MARLVTVIELGVAPPDTVVHAPVPVVGYAASDAFLNRYRYSWMFEWVGLVQLTSTDPGAVPALALTPASVMCAPEVMVKFALVDV